MSISPKNNGGNSPILSLTLPYFDKEKGIFIYSKDLIKLYNKLIIKYLMNIL